MIEIKEEFEVAADGDAVWKVISDPYQVVDCVPGASITNKIDDTNYEGAIGIKFGPTSVMFQTNVTLALDAASHSGNLTSRSKDKRGGTRSTAITRFSVVPVPAGSRVTVDSSIEITGALAGLVENGASFVMKKLLGIFAERLAAKCGKAGESTA